jgi:hypothetical protein
MNDISKIKIFISSDSMGKFLSIIACLLVFTLVVYGSIWQGYYNIDPHHWGLMLSNAKDFHDGKIPYQQIFIQYGLLTTIIHAIAYGVAGGNLVAIIAITAIAYGVGLLLIYRITLVLTNSRKISFIVLITCFLIHPNVIYPWSNYVAFPFFIFGMLMLVQSPQSQKRLFYSGLSFGLAILSREGLAPAILLLVTSSILIDLFTQDRCRWNYIKNISWLISGILLPLGFFSLYLSFYELWPYWYKLSWLLPNIYIAEIFPHVAGFGGIWALMTHILNRSGSLDFRWLIFGVVICVNLFTIILFISRLKHAHIKSAEAKIAIATLLLLSSSLHIPEIFRLATGSVIGVITLHIFLARINHINISFILILYTLGLTLIGSNSGNYFVPNSDQVKNAQTVTAPSFFKGQRWQSNVIDYYQQIDNDLKDIKNSSCPIAYHYNYSMDAFLQILSPYPQYQIAPFGLGAKMSSLRKDLNIEKKIKDADDLLIFRMIPQKDYSDYKPEKGFFVFKSYSVPSAYFIPTDNRLLILIPSACEKLVLRYDASIEQGIDFTRSTVPSFVKNIVGLSNSEPWGRWSDANLAPSVAIELNDPLPNRFNLMFSAQAFGPNSGQDLKVRVGSQLHYFKMQDGVFEYRKLIELKDEKVMHIYFSPPWPTSPQQLEMSADSRKLGVGLIHLQFGK